MYINFNNTVSGKNDTPVYIAVTLQRLVSFVWNCTHINCENNQQELWIYFKEIHVNVSFITIYITPLKVWQIWQGYC